jgi:hypothetical protein
MIPETKEAWDEAKARLAKTVATVEEQRSRIALIKEKVAVARLFFL